MYWVLGTCGSGHSMYQSFLFPLLLMWQLSRYPLGGIPIHNKKEQLQDENYR